MTISYEEFGRRLIEAIVTADRVERTLARVAGGEFETSIKLAAGLVRAHGSGGVTKVEVDLIDADILAFAATLHFDMELLVRVSGVPNQYHGTGRIALALRPLINEDLSIVIDVPHVTTDDVTLKLRPDGTVAAIIDQLGSVEDQTRRELARYVNTRAHAPEMVEHRRIDTGEMIETEWRRRQG